MKNMASSHVPEGLVFPQFAHESAAEFFLFKCHSPFYHRLYSLIL